MPVSLIIGTVKGGFVAHSDDRTTWRVDPMFVKGWSVTSAARTADGKTYAAVASDIFAPAVMVSDDLKTWTQLPNGPAYGQGQKGNADHIRMISKYDFEGKHADGQRYLDQIWKLHAVGNDLYAGVSEAGLFRSRDGGASWEPIDGLNDHPDREKWMPGAGGLCAHSILVDEANPDRLWVGISAAGVFRSDDGGKTWAPKNDGIASREYWCVHGLAHDPNNADVIYRQDHRGMYLSRDAGDSWQVIENGLPQATLFDDHVCAFGFPVAFDPKSGAAFGIPLDGDQFRFPRDGNLQVFRTQNAGEAWQSVSSGLPDQCYASVLRGAMAVDKMDPCGVYFGTTTGDVFVSGDGAQSWQRLDATFPRVLSVDAFAA